jgi:AraC family transcriptional regulator, regulatory protein of adaptative response / DNA-3-methyladenine glycosylase II
MSGVSAVVTTGIYCRPGCSARPNAANVRHFDLAAGAEVAGYRACLRCRPYRAAAPIQGVASEVVCRGIRLVIGRGSRSDSEVALAADLGVSARHLRRLFQEHVGVTPAQLARSSRAHFARRLLDETDLSITEIAFASGFGSLRQFNRTINEIFRATPRELRARRRVADRLVADGGLRLRLGFTGPLDWEAMLGYLAARAISGVERISEGVYRRTVVLDGDPGAIELVRGGSDNLILTAHLPHWGGLIHVVQQVRRLFNLDVDLDGANRLLGGDPTLGSRIASMPGLRPPGTWDPFEVGVRAIIGQQVTVTGAGTIIARLVSRHGSPVPGLGQLGLTHVFPSAEVLATADLGGTGLTGARMAAISNFAAAVAGGSIRLDGSQTLDDQVTALIGVPGLGPWTAHYLALRMGEADAFPSTDLGLRRSLEALTQVPVTPREVAGMAERWRPWRAHAAIHLWLTPRVTPAVARTT